MQLLSVWFCSFVVGVGANYIGKGIVNARGPPPQPTKPPGKCEIDEFVDLRKCYVNYLANYNVEFGNDTLPHQSSKVFDKVWSNIPVLCSNYAPFKSCESSAAAHCVNFENLQKMAGDESDALYYLQQLALIELFCDHSKEYIQYNQCMERIDMNELQELVYDECELNIKDDCRAVQKTVKCERGVISMVCDAKQSIDSYCTYQNIQMRRAAWNYCYDMPCHSSLIFTGMTYFIVMYILFCYE